MNKTVIAIVGAVAGGLALIVGATVFLTNIDTSTTPPFSSSAVTDLSIVQQSAHGYDVSLDLSEEIAADELQAVQLTENPDYADDQATEVEFERDGANLMLETQQLAPGDHYLWLTTPTERVPVVVTIPAMQPRVWMDGKRPMIEFGQSGDSSWSSYVDPEGKNVYASASPVFDDDAVPLGEGIEITKTSFRVENPLPEHPYYFLVFTGRDGHSTFVSSPLFATATQGPVTVELTRLDDQPTYVISGFLASRESAIDRTLSLRVGNFNASNPSSTFFVENSYEGAAIGQFRFQIPAAQIAEGYNDLVIFLDEDGSTLEWSIDATGVDLSQRLEDGQSVFGIRRVEALQLTRLNLLYDSISVSLVGRGDTALLQVSGRFTEAASGLGYGLVVKDSAGERHTVDDGASSARSFYYSINLASLGVAGTWYDVEFALPNSDKSVPISTTSVFDMRQWVATGSRTYAFADYEGLLKVFFDAKPFANAHVELATVDGAPSLVATGDLVGITRSDASLRIRTNNNTIADVPNSSAIPGTFRFVYNLATLPTPGTWFDVTFRVASTDRVTDFPVTAVTDLAQTLRSGAFEYAFHDFNGQLKVEYHAIPGTVEVTSAEIVNVLNIPTLRVEGTLEHATASDVFLRIRTAGQTIDVPNTATAAGEALFVYDLSGLSEQGDWYDVLIGVTSTGALTDVGTATADLAQTVTLGGRAYSFHDFNSQLKVAFDPAPATISVTSAVIADVSGVPTLQVTGTVSGATGTDLYLRLRSAGQTIDVTNVASTPGTLSFAYDLSALTQAGTWYDLLVGVTSTGQLTDVSETAANLSQTLLLNSRTYAFHQYAGDLKVAFDDTPVAVAATSAELLDVAGVPTLQVVGTYSGVVGSDVFLRIRSAGQTIDVPNTSTMPGVLSFAYDGSDLTQAGTWYDVLLGVTSTAQLTDLSSALADQSQTVTVGGRTYEFHEYDDDLKVAFQTGPVIGGAVAEIVNVGGTPTLRVTGTLVNTPNGDVYLRIRSGAQTVDVPNTAVTSGAALFEYDLSDLTGAGTWYDLVIGVTSTGDLKDLPYTVADPAQTVSLGGRAYAFHEYLGALKVAFATVPIATSVTSAELVDVASTPILRVTGTLTGTDSADAFLRINTGAQTVNVPNSATVAGTTLFEYDLAGLTEKGTWYNLGVGITSTSDLDDISPSVADLLQTITRDNREYVFHDWLGALKLAFGDAAASVTVDSTELLDVSGNPTLRVSGTVEGTTDDDVFLRIHAGSQTVDVPNSAVTPGDALFEYDLSGLDDAGVSYDLVIGATSTGNLFAVADSTATLAQTVALGGRTYFFTATAGALGVEFSDTPAAVTATSAEILNVAGVPTLRVSGTVTGTSNADAFLRIRTAGQTINVANTATTAGEALFQYDLSGLTTPANWYDLLVGTTSTGTLVDLLPAAADLSQSLAVAGHSYEFRQSAGALKVTFSNVPVTVSVSSAELVVISGSPVLRVSGTVTGTISSDTFLRVRTGTTIIDVPNSSSVAGSVLFEQDLSVLTAAGTWYDLLIGVTSKGTLTDLSDSVASMTQTVTVGDYKYAFHSYTGDLKVAFADISPAVTLTSAQVVNVSGVPTLVVSGTVANTTNADVFLRLRSGATTIDVPNSAVTAGMVTFSYNLSGLTLPGIWYDALVGISSRGTLTEQPASLGNTTATLNIAGRSYGLHEYFGLLKVAYDNVTLASGQSIRIDFGPNDVNDTTRDGNATTSPDVYGKYWNNMSWPNASAAPAANTSNVVPNGLAASGLLTTTNVATTTAVTMNGTSWLTNGLTTGGLLAPTFANLNDFAIATATQDYFFIQNGTTGGTLTLSGLDPYRLYDLKFFGTRNATEVRKTTYTVTGSNGVQTAELQTSGTGLGAGGYNGNNNTIVTIAGSQPTTAGTLQIKVSGTQVNFGYLAFLEITGSTPVTPPPPPPPAEVSRWLAQDAADPVVPNSVLFIGSSTIRRWESLTYDFADYNVIQRGWGGAWLSGVNDYASWVVDPYNPSAIVLWAGTNDITGGKTPQQLLTDFRTFVTREHADSPSTDILYISMTPTPGNGATDAARRQANALIAAETHTDPKLHFIDVATYFENLQVSDPAAFTALYVDSLHLSPSGYATWVSMVRPALAAVVPPNKSVVANPSTLQPGEKLLFDFGPSNVADGDPTGTDTLGNRWNNWVPTSGGGLVNIGEHIAGLVDTTGRNTGLKMKITGGFQVNGKNNGGLFAPNGPNAALLGDLAVQTATEDYFYSSADGKWDGGNDDLPGGFMIEGLDPALQYEFRFFGSRATTEVRVTEYSVRGANSGAANLQTSGAGMGSNGIYNGNDSGVAVVSGIRPDAFGQVFIDVTLIQGSYTHLNAMELLATTP